MITDEVRQALMSDWLKPQEAAHRAGVSYGWIKLLGERGRVETLQTPLGTLYRRDDVERLAEEREAKKAVA